MLSSPAMNLSTAIRRNKVNIPGNEDGQQQAIRPSRYRSLSSQFVKLIVNIVNDVTSDKLAGKEFQQSVALVKITE